MIDLATVRLAAKLSRAAYGDTPLGAQAEAEALGFEGVTRIARGDVNAVLGHKDGWLWVAASGTHFTEKTSLPEIWDNLKGDLVDIGAQVHSGYWGRALRLWWEIRGFIEGPVRFVGHSLGGATAHLLPYFLPPETVYEVITFGAPKAADAVFWKAVYRPDLWFRGVRERDFAPAWPESMADLLPADLARILPIHAALAQPGPAAWLHNREFTWVDARPGVNASVPDHSVDLYCADCDVAPGLPPVNWTA